MSAPAARRFVAAELARRELDWLVGTAELLTSELVTNAVLHARSEVEVTVRVAPHRVRVEVADGEVALPEPRQAAAAATTGRGLFIVEKLAAAWGADRNAAGKHVWFELAS